MSAPAFFWYGWAVYWPGIFAALGALCAGLGMLAFRGFQGRSLGAAAAFFPVAVLFSLVLGRFFHWFCHPLSYAGFWPAMTGYETGGFALAGAFAGVLLAAGLFRLAGFIPRLGEFLDAAAPAAGLGIAVGRLGDRFSTADRSWFVPAQEGFPFSLPVTDAAGTVSWRFPVFLWQAAAAFVLFLLFALLFIRARRARWPQGSLFWLFLSFYSAGQAVLDSTRYDRGGLPCNAFISLTQLLCLLSILTAALAFTGRACRRGRRLLLGWGLVLAGCAAGSYLEYFVQRQSGRYLLAYGLMSLCFALAALGVCLLFRAGRPLPPGGDPSSPSTKAAAALGASAQANTG